MTVADVLERVSEEELRSWKAFYRLSPWDGVRLDYLATQVCTVIAQTFRSKNSPPIDPDQFFPKWGSSASRQQTGKDMEATMRAFAALNNAFHEKKKGKANGNNRLVKRSD